MDKKAWKQLSHDFRLTRAKLGSIPVWAVVGSYWSCEERGILMKVYGGFYG